MQNETITNFSRFENPKVGKKFLEVVRKPAHEIKIIFIPNAATTEGGKYYVRKCEGVEWMEKLLPYA